jgi:pseudouridine-5'-phosphate glycosidase
VTARVESARDVAAVARAAWQLGTSAGLLVGVPPPPGTTLDTAAVERAVTNALAEADRRGISGAGVTPFLLGAIADATGGESVDANLALLENNARVAAEIAVALAS